MEVIKYCPECKDFKYFMWCIEREDLENNHKDFFLTCTSCGFSADEPKLDTLNPNYPKLLDNLATESPRTALGAI